jgi:ubiquitin-activating enzyme E1 C
MGIVVNRDVYQTCTIAETPRLPEHAIAYIYLLKWKDNFSRPIDTDSIDDVTWIFEQAKKRADAFGIEGVTYSLTLGVIKGVIPAIASTNAIIAAATVLEAIKYLSGCSKMLDNNFLYLGHEGLNSITDRYERNDECMICNTRVYYRKVDRNATFGDFLR